MNITDELREWFKNRAFFGNGYAELTAIADRIDERHKHAIRYVDDRDPDTMTENGWIRLPKDADGEPIHVGDVMEWVRYKDDDPTIVCKVSAVGNDVFFAWSDEQGRYAQYKNDAYRHHHAPTVEDVLREFGIDWEHESDCEDRAALLKEYAAKLQLRED